MAKRIRKKKNSPDGAPLKRPQAKNTPTSSDRKLLLIRAALIVIVGLWVFSPALNGSWLWDDDTLITKNDTVHDPSGLWKIWFEPTSSLVDYFPLTVSAEWLQWQLWQDNQFWYHLVSLILHLVSSLLIWRLLDKFGLHLAWLGGLLFAIHPITVESVAWIAELKNTLSLPLFLLAMCRWIDYDEKGKREDYFWALGLFVAAMLAKSTMVMFPVVILLYAWWKRGRVDLSDVRASAPFFAVSLVLGLVTVWFLHAYAIGKTAIPMGGFFSHLALAGLSLAFYFSKCFWPVGLLPIYPKWEIDPVSPVQFIPWLVLSGVLYWLWTKRAGWGRHALLGLGFFLINLVPFIGFTAASYMEFTWVMDHLLYLPLIGLIGLAVTALGQIEQSLSGAARLFALGLMMLVMALLAWESHWYAGIFIDQETLWTYTLRYNPEAWIARINLGNIFEDRKQLSEALVQYKLALKSNPGSDMAHYNKGNVFVEMGRFAEAKEEYEQALRIDSSYANAHGNLGGILFRLGETSEAIEQYRLALKLAPDDADTHANLGVALMTTGHPKEAVEQFQQCLKISPNMPGVHQRLEEALQQNAPKLNQTEVRSN